MGTHPNAILMAVLTPDDLARETYRAILKFAKVENHKDDQIEIGSKKYHHVVMEGSYDESWQISAKEGEIAIFDLVTYGYGESISWEKLEKQKSELEEFCRTVCEKFHCKHRIEVTANYW